MTKDSVKRALTGAAALAAFATAGVAQAQIAHDGQTTGGSDLVLFVSAAVGNANPSNFYYVDLGQTFDNVLVNYTTVQADVTAGNLYNKNTGKAGSFALPTSLDIAAGANAGLASFLSTNSADTLKWTILAGNAIGNGVGGSVGQTSFAATTTVNWLTSFASDNNVVSMLGQGGTAGMIPFFDEETATNPSTTVGWGNTSDTAGKGGPTSWISALFNNGALVGTAMPIYELSNSNNGTAQVYLSSNTIVLKSDGSLTVAASPVPIPAAAWLLGSGLLGLLGIARRKASPALA